MRKFVLPITPKVLWNPKQKKLETKIKGFFQNQELNNSGFECILLVSTRVLNFATSNCCQLFHAHLDFTMSTLDTFSYPSRWVFFPPIFFLFHNGGEFLPRKHILHWNMLFPSFSPKESLLQIGLLDLENVQWGTLYIPILPPQQNKLFYELHHVGFINLLSFYAMKV